MTVKNIDVLTLKNWLENSEVVLIDVREIEEYRTGKIADAKLIPVGEITTNLLPEIKNKKLVIYCRSGKRSAFACEKLAAEGLKADMYNLDGGIISWVAAGLSVA